MAWRQTGDKPLSEPVMASLTAAYASVGLNELNSAAEAGMSILWLLMPWGFREPGHEQQWRYLWRINAPYFPFTRIFINQKTKAIITKHFCAKHVTNMQFHSTGGIIITTQAVMLWNNVIILNSLGANPLHASPLRRQATGLDAWASRVKCPARFVSHLHEICIPGGVLTLWRLLYMLLHFNPPFSGLWKICIVSTPIF